MLTTTVLERILAAIPAQTIGVCGDLFLDRYLDLDAALTEPSLETGLDAYQVASVRSVPGAAGTVINNLAALGVKSIVPISMIGDDGEGYELRQALRQMPSVEMANLVISRDRRTPTYTKPMLRKHGEPAHELNRLDIKNRTPLPAIVETTIIDRLAAVWASVDGWLVLDQVSEAECGVVTACVRDRLAELGGRDPGKIVLADSREQIGLFRNVRLKPNERECLRAVGNPLGVGRAFRPECQAGKPDLRSEGGTDISGAILTLSERTQRPIFCTRGNSGMLVAEPGTTPIHVPAYRVEGPIDPVGAGDSSSAALCCALVGGASLTQAAAFGNLVASITIQQIGATGTATPTQIRERWRVVG